MGSKRGPVYRDKQLKNSCPDFWNKWSRLLGSDEMNSWRAILQIHWMQLCINYLCEFFVFQLQSRHKNLCWMNRSTSTTQALHSVATEWICKYRNWKDIENRMKTNRKYLSSLHRLRWFTADSHDVRPGAEFHQHRRRSRRHTVRSGVGSSWGKRPRGMGGSHPGTWGGRDVWLEAVRLMVSQSHKLLHL